MGNYEAVLLFTNSGGFLLAGSTFLWRCPGV